MTVSRPFLISYAVAMSVLAAPCMAGDDLGARFIAEHGPALEKLEARFAQIHGSGKWTLQHLGNPPGKRIVTAVEFKLDGPRQWLEMRNLSGGGASWISSTTDGSAFRVSRKSPDAPATLANMEASSKAGGVEQTIRLFRKDFLDAPFAVSFPIRKLTASKVHYKLTGMSPATTTDGHRALKVEYEQSFEIRGNKVVQTCFFVLDLELASALREHQIKAGESIISRVVEYGPVVDGFPTPKRVKIVMPNELKEFEFDDFAFGPTPASAFTLEAAGMPGLDAPRTSASRGQASRWLIIGGTTLSLLAVAIAVWSRLKSRRPEVSAS